jgi:hypothetical protein
VGLLVSQLSAAQSPEQPWVSEWSNTPPYLVVGTSGSPGIPSSLPFAKVPVVGVDAARRVLSGEPSEWRVDRVLGCTYCDYDTVDLIDRNGRRFVCMIQSNKWFVLSETNCLDNLNRALKSWLSDDATFTNVDVMAGLVSRIASFSEGPCRAITKRVDRNLPNEGDMGSWLFGTERNEKVLRDLCVDPTVETKAGDLLIKCNVLSFDGSVIEWAIFVTTPKPHRVLHVSRREIRHKGTFTLPDVR